ncbi:hypothetical protein CDL12_14605 [Handroanthus impetiginosus]|uniref:Uncharacterized protein n=1 Tax=Handroanthus impetiginosus TaxID=429701 RepID=A0A2G9H5J3_9LAMI|nr:hypothetical protein CDL12_14605 [Handroanthus impetiginosus]
MDFPLPLFSCISLLGIFHVVIPSYWTLLNGCIRVVSYNMVVPFVAKFSCWVGFHTIFGSALGVHLVIYSFPLVRITLDPPMR